MCPFMSVSIPAVEFGRTYSVAGRRVHVLVFFFPLTYMTKGNIFDLEGRGQVLTKHTHVFICRCFLFHRLLFWYLKCIQSEQKRHEVMARLEVALEELSAERSKSLAIMGALNDFTKAAVVQLAPSDFEEGRARNADGGLEVDSPGSGVGANGSGCCSAAGCDLGERAGGVEHSGEQAENGAMDSGGLSAPSAKYFIGNPWNLGVPEESAPRDISK